MRAGARKIEIQGRTSEAEVIARLFVGHLHCDLGTFSDLLQKIADLEHKDDQADNTIDQIENVEIRMTDYFDVPAFLSNPTFFDDCPIPKGIGELGNVGMNAGVANAVYHATGMRTRKLPIRIEKLLLDQ